VNRPFRNSQHLRCRALAAFARKRLCNLAEGPVLAALMLALRSRPYVSGPTRNWIKVKCAAWRAEVFEKAK
jgi:ATP-dependent DNA ligase